MCFCLKCNFKDELTAWHGKNLSDKLGFSADDCLTGLWYKLLPGLKYVYSKLCLTSVTQKEMA